ncbi:MAG: hypothetical protein AAGC45_12020 [Bacteroidota bacterium]
MNDKENTSHFVDELLDSAESIQTVDTSPFFKDKVLGKLVQEKDHNGALSYPSWLTPKFQWAALLIFVFLNLGVLYYHTNYYQQQELQSFAETYGFSSFQGDSILN